MFGRRLGVALVLATAVVGVSGCAAPSAPLDLSGDLFVHDPALVVGDAGEPWFAYSTGNGQVADGNIQIRSSNDGSEWEYVGEVWQQKPEWLVEAVPGVDNLWAPELYEHDGLWYLYYSASTFGSNSSLIALATNATLDPESPDYEWVDRGEVMRSGGTDFNAIDAGIVEDEHGTPWMAFGSFWSGIRMVELTWPSGLRADDAEPVQLADRQSPPNAVEAPFITAKDGWYYLLVSRDSCCKGIDSTYNIAVGRSRAVTGPYLDGNGVSMLEDGGTPLLASDDAHIGPGGQSVSGGFLGFHWYDPTQNGLPQLGLVPLEWKDGWPSVAWE